MEETTNFIVSVWHNLANSLGGEALSIIFMVGFVAALTALYFGVSAFRKTEFYKQNKTILELVDGRITDLIFLLEFGDVDLTEYKQREAQREMDGLEFIDARMLYLLDRVGAWVKDRLGVELDMEELLARAEHIFNEVANSESNSVVSGN